MPMKQKMGYSYGASKMMPGAEGIPMMSPTMSYGMGDKEMMPGYGMKKKKKMMNKGMKKSRSMKNSMGY